MKYIKFFEELSQAEASAAKVRIFSIDEIKYDQDARHNPEEKHQLYLDDLHSYLEDQTNLNLDFVKEVSDHEMAVNWSKVRPYGSSHGNEGLFNWCYDYKIGFHPNFAIIETPELSELRRVIEKKTQQDSFDTEYQKDEQSLFLVYKSKFGEQRFDTGKLLVMAVLNKNGKVEKAIYNNREVCPENIAQSFLDKGLKVN